MVRGLMIAIGIMTVAIIAIFAAIVARMLDPEPDERGEVAPPEGTIDFAAAPVVEIGLPPGARVIATHISADRVTFEIETVQGERGVYTTPLSGFDQPVRLVFHSLE
jgi:hypothetical protein